MARLTEQDPSIAESAKRKKSAISAKMQQDELMAKKDDNADKRKRVVMNRSKEKDRQISAKVNSKTYDLFKRINAEEGISNNSSLNMLITNFVREKKYLLENDEI